MATQYPKRLIEVDLPIKRISEHARREKNIRHGHISTLHVWWARKPLATCRAAICAALWPDPANPNCPAAFRENARGEMQKWTTHERQAMLSAESRIRFEKARHNPALFRDTMQLRGALLDYIADFANWDNSTVKEFLDTSRVLTQAAHEALGGTPGTKPLVVDPFAGGGSIPLEALRVGSDAFASDLNPVSVFLNKVVTVFAPRYPAKLADEIRRCGSEIKAKAKQKLEKFYPLYPDGSRPIAYFWSRVIRCEGPGCDTFIPLRSSFWLANKASQRASIRLKVETPGAHIPAEVLLGDQAIQLSAPTVKRGKATCPRCGYSTPATNVRSQFTGRAGGAEDAQLLAIATIRSKASGRQYRTVTRLDEQTAKDATTELKRLIAATDSVKSGFSIIPDEPLPYLRSIFNISLLDVKKWGELFFSRQALALITIMQLIQESVLRVRAKENSDFAQALESLLACAFDRQVDFSSSLCTWWPGGEKIQHTFGRQALPIFWDFAEVNPLSDSTGCWEGAYEWTAKFCEHIANSNVTPGTVAIASAASHPLPNDSADALVTDPPYYDLVPYADLSDFFYVWLKRLCILENKELFRETLSPKKGEVVQLAERNKDYAFKTKAYFEDLMGRSLTECRRVGKPGCIGVVFFAHKETGAWETQLQAVIEAGWIITASWPIDTEMGTRLRAMNSAVLASSIVLVCRPRENLDGFVRNDEIGDWRDVLAGLPRRIHDWMPRLAEEGVVGADAIFACIGPALEIFSRYSRVEKANGEAVTLKEYLEQVWAAVAKEALTMIFTDADATGFEEDARLTAMWLWTLKTGDADGAEDEGAEEESDGDEEGGGKKTAIGGFVLEFDAARKIAQGLGAHLERLPTVVEAKGETARLLSVGERANHLFGKEPSGPKEQRRKKKAQPSLFAPMDEVEEEVKGWEIKAGKIGETILDRLHQSMILFGTGRGEALRRFLVEDGAGRDQRLWRLAQAFSALYPAGTDEKRWVDGVLARKKGLGL